MPKLKIERAYCTEVGLVDTSTRGRSSAGQDRARSAHPPGSLVARLVRAFPRRGPAWFALAAFGCAHGGAFYSLQVENDLFGSGNDRFYTHGTELAYMRTGPAPDWLRTLSDVLPLFKTGERVATGYAVGQKIFTPADTRSSELVTDDRPYAGWLYGTATIGSVAEEDADSQVIDAMSLTLGWIGPSARADDIQREYHELIGVDVPQGWDNQLRDEPGINLGMTRKWRHFGSFARGPQWELSPHVAAALGNVYTYAATGLMARVGNDLRRDVGPPNISPGFPGAPYFAPDGGNSWYLFGGIEVRAVARDIFLDGNTFKDSHSVDREPLVADIQFGAAVQFDNVRVAISNVYRSREFEGQHEPVRYGGINVTVYTD